MGFRAESSAPCEKKGKSDPEQKARHSNAPHVGHGWYVAD